MVRIRLWQQQKKKENEKKDVFRLSFLNDLFWLGHSGVVCIPNVLQLVR